MTQLDDPRTKYCTRRAIFKTILLIVLVINILYYGHVKDALPARWLRIAGFQDVRTYSRSGSLEDWEHENRPCTHTVFREYYHRYGYFPSGGAWHEVNRSGKRDYFFMPKACRLKYVHLPPKLLANCFSRGKIASILTMGDSNAQRYFFELVNLVKSISRWCITSRREELKMRGLLPDRAYFTRDDPLLKRIVNVHYRYCRGCGGLEVTCNWTRDASRDPRTTEPQYSTKIEHLPMTGILDTSVSALVPFDMYHNKSTSYLTQTHKTATAPEFFFKLYLKNQYPDILIVFLPFNHVKSLDSFSRFEADIRYFHSLVLAYVPRTTKVFYMPAFREFESARNTTFWQNKKFNGLLAWEMIDRLNRILFQTIKEDLLNKSRNIYGMFDLVNMSATRGGWSEDGVHMAPEWYVAVTSQFWEILCRSMNIN